MFEKRFFPVNVKKKIYNIKSDNCDLSIHTWIPEQPKAAIFYFHGLQSHAGWLWEAGHYFADNDISFFVMDRRGSGLSGGLRGDISTADSVLLDYKLGIEWVREYIGDNLPLSLFGHCLGGSFMAALMHDVRFETSYQSAIFCSSWLGKLHNTLNEQQLDVLSVESSIEPWSVGLKSCDFTGDLRYQNFIDSDMLAINVMTKRSRKALFDIEKFYMDSNVSLPDVPIAFVSGNYDPVIDLSMAHSTFLKMTKDKGTILKLPTDKHYLFYTNVSRNLVDWASTFTLFETRQAYA